MDKERKAELGDRSFWSSTVSAMPNAVNWVQAERPPVPTIKAEGDKLSLGLDDPLIRKSKGRSSCNKWLRKPSARAAVQRRRGDFPGDTHTQGFDQLVVFRQPLRTTC